MFTIPLRFFTSFSTFYRSSKIPYPVEKTKKVRGNKMMNEAKATENNHEVYAEENVVEEPDKTTLTPLTILNNMDREAVDRDTSVEIIPSKDLPWKKRRRKSQRVVKEKELLRGAK